MFASLTEHAGCANANVLNIVIIGNELVYGYNLETKVLLLQ